MTCSEEYNFDSTITYSVLVAPSKEWLSSTNSWLIIKQLLDRHRQLRTAWSAQDSHYYPPSHIPRVISIGELSLSNHSQNHSHHQDSLSPSKCNIILKLFTRRISASIFHKNADAPGIRRANLSFQRNSQVKCLHQPIKNMLFGPEIDENSDKTTFVCQEYKWA